MVSVCLASCDAVCKVETAILYLMRTRPNAKLVKDSEQRNKLAKEIIIAANEYNQSAYLLTAIFYSESSFDHRARGSMGEVGIGQIGNTSRTKCKAIGLNTGLRADQIKCTAYLLHGYQSKCGTTKGAVTAYAGWGRCKTDSVTKQKQVRYKLWLAKKLEKVGNNEKTRR
jgi:hypothetical protein